MVLEVFLGQRDLLDGHDPVRRPLQHRVDQGESHGGRIPGSAAGARGRTLRVVPTIRDEAVCVRLWDWSETSQTVSLFTREHGMLRGLAKGAKREHAPYSGGFELLTRGEVVAIVKKEGQLATLTAWDLSDPWRALRGTLDAFYAGCAAADVVHHAVTDHDPHPELYDALTGALASAGGDPAGSVLRLVWATLVETGYRPSLEKAADTGGSLADAETFGFSPRLGGLVPDPAGQAPASTTQGPVWRVRGETVRLLRELGRDTPVSVGIAATGVGSDWAKPAVHRAVRLLLAYLSEILGREPPAVRAFLGTLPA
ncbi:MAG: DNA repair protein RecO [Phycisphaerales bacterium]|nr:MAG: DNA repair protein RecO [Phycisphaerales bacterium]